MKISTFFYFLSILFIWTEIFQIRNRIRLQLIEVQRIDPLKWIIFYLSKIAYFLWVPFGLFTDNYKVFIILILLKLIKLLIIKMKKDFYINLYDLISCVISVFLLSYLIYSGVVLLLL